MSNVIIVGCGRVGSQLANMLSNGNNNVSVIDTHPDAFIGLGQNFNGNEIVGVGFDEDTLKQAGIEDCDIVLAVTQHDNTNLMVSEVARRIFNVEHVVARLHNPDHERSYTQLGIDYVCGTTLVAQKMFSKVISETGAHMDVFGDYQILKFSLDLSTVNRDSVKVFELERDHEVRIVAFERADGSLNSIPTKDSVLRNGDTVLACVKNDMFRQFRKFILD